MSKKDIERVTVVGAGTMGSQIAQLLARVSKCSITMTDINDEIIKNAYVTIRSRLQRYFVDKNKITQTEMEEIVSRIDSTTDLATSVRNADFIIECTAENLEMKRKVFMEVDANKPSETILASNTSGLSITELANATSRPEKVVGMHFFNPVDVMRLVEVVRGALTSDDTLTTTCDFATKIGKEPVVCRDVGYGFLANRAYSALRDEAVQMVWERTSSPAEIDKALKLGYNLPIGPLELGDMIGSWKIWASSEQDRVRELGQRGRLHPLVRLMVRAGYVGGPGKKGIYDFWREVLTKW